MDDRSELELAMLGLTWPIVAQMVDFGEVLCSWWAGDLSQQRNRAV